MLSGVSCAMARRLTQNPRLLDVMGQEVLVGGTVASKPAGSREALVFPTILQDCNLLEDVAPSCDRKIMGLNLASATHQQ